MNASSARTTVAAGRMHALGAAVVLVLAGGLLLLLQWIGVHREYRADAEAQARVVASGSAAAVMFGDADGARETLAPLASAPAVRAAEILDGHGQVLARFPDDAGTGLACGTGCIEVSAPVLFRDRERVGMVRLQIDTARARARLWGLAIAFGIAALAAYALAYPLLLRMRERIRGAESRLRDLAHFDPVTRLHNRNAFNLQLESCRTRAGRVALVQFDLDRFKEVNDRLGHQGGDELLLLVAKRVAGALEEGQHLYRLGGDEFAVVVLGDGPIGRVRDWVGAMLARLSAPFVVDGVNLHVTASAGIAIWPDTATRIEEVAGNADIAMYCAKREGRNRVAVFEPPMRAAQLARIAIRDALEQAIAREQLQLHYQPQVCAASGRLHGVEALLRWHHPDLGTVPPSTFIPIAEEGPLIIELGRWVIDEACRQIARWHSEGLGHVRVAVNLSVRHTRDDALPGFIDQALRGHGVPPHCLELELTESVLMEEADVAVAQLARLRARGLQLAIDDFGTGYSSMAYLRRLPIDKLKIDMAFVQAIPGEGEAITNAILAMARAFELRVVAEGVETVAQRDYLRAAGCQLLQGYLFDRPLPARDFAVRWLHPAHGRGSSSPPAPAHAHASGRPRPVQVPSAAADNS